MALVRPGETLLNNYIEMKQRHIQPNASRGCVIFKQNFQFSIGRVSSGQTVGGSGLVRK